MLGGGLRRMSPSRERGGFDVRRAVGDNSSVRTQAWELWNNVQGALVGVASTRLTEYLNALVPGFDEHYHRAEQRRLSSR